MSDTGTPTGRDSFATAVRLLKEALPPRWKLYLLSIVCMIGVAGFTGALAYSTRLIVNDVFVAEDAGAAIRVALLVVGVALGKSIFQYANSVISVVFNRSVGAHYQRLLFEKMLSMDVWHFAGEHASGQMSRVRLYGQACGTSVVNISIKTLGDALTLIALFGVMLFQDPLMTLASCVIFPLIVLLVSRLSRRVRSTARSEAHLTGAYHAIGTEAFTSIKTVKSFGLEAKLANRFNEAVGRLEQRLVRMARITAATVPVMEFLGGLMIGLFVIYASWQTITYGKTPGEFTAFITAFLLAYQPAERVSHSWVEIQKSLTHVGLMYGILDSSPRQLPSGTRPLDDPRPSLRFDHVSFEYDAETPALRDVSFELAPGEKVAIVGASGAGKSTLIDLVMRFYDPTEGHVTLSGVPVAEFSDQALRRSIALISQDVFIFDGTIRENIRDGLPEADDAAVEAAARQAALDEVIDGPGEGLDRQVGPNGSNLSGGQRQRVAIARALVREAKIYVFDEATSALDPEIERRIMQTLARDLPDATMLFVTHRPAPLAYVDRVIVLSNGKLVGFGPLAELEASSAEFRALFGQ